MGRTGLTFVELLMAVAIFSIVAVGLSAHLRGAVTTWRRTQSIIEQAQRARLVTRQLSQDLANAALIETGEQARLRPEWHTDHLAFATFDPMRQQLLFVEYAIEHDDGQDQLIRRALPYQVAAAGESEPAHRLVLLRDVERFRIRYAESTEGPPKWAFRDSAWPLVEALPRLLEITVEQDPRATSKRNAEPVRLRLVRPIPSGRLQLEEETPGELP